MHTHQSAPRFAHSSQEADLASLQPSDPIVPATERLAYSPREAAVALGCGLTFLYEQMGAGRILALKAGRRTVIPADSLKRFLESLPVATIRTGTSG